MFFAIFTDASEQVCHGTGFGYRNNDCFYGGARQRATKEGYKKQ
jgi:hypothetical protein